MVLPQSLLTYEIRIPKVEFTLYPSNIKLQKAPCKQCLHGVGSYWAPRFFLSVKMVVVVVRCMVPYVVVRCSRCVVNACKGTVVMMAAGAKRGKAEHGQAE